MELISPRKPEGRVWLSKFNEYIYSWIAGQFSDSFAIDQAVEALRNLVEREPDCAGLVANILSTILSQHEQSIKGVSREQTCLSGLIALKMVSGKTELYLQTHWNLSNHFGQALLEQSRYGEVMDITIENYQSGLQESMIKKMLLARYLAVKSEAQEALLDQEHAFEGFKEGLEIIREILDNEELLGKLFTENMIFAYPQNPPSDKNLIQAQIQLLWRSLSGLRIRMVRGLCRCAIFVDPSNLNVYMEQMMDTFLKQGIGSTPSIEIASLVSRVNTEYAIGFTEKFLQQVRDLNLKPEDFECVLFAGICSTSKEKEIIDNYLEKAISGLQKTQDPFLRAATYGLLICASEIEDTDMYVNAFIDEILYLGDINDPRLLDPAMRLVFDEPILETMHSITETKDGYLPWDEFTRILVARLIDYNFAGSTPLDHWVPRNGMDNSLLGLRDISQDYLGRIQYVLNSKPGNLVLIFRTFRQRTLMIGLSSNAQPVGVFVDDQYACLTQELFFYLQKEIPVYLTVGSFGPMEELKGLCQEAYKNIHQTIRELIEQNECILLCPDHRENGGAIPFELFHDGNEWLGISKSTARFPTLRSVTRSLEKTNKFNFSKRILSVAVTELPEQLKDDYLELEYAKDEVEQIRKDFKEIGWDAPEIEQYRISPDFILKRLSYVSHLHIASHGESKGLQEALILYNGNKLFASDLISRFIPNMPSAYINACELGMTRWTGAGKAQSIPYAFLEAGSRAVIASMLPLEDEISKEFAYSFYSENASHDFGTSLRNVRKKLKEKKVHPILWGTIILFGDPSFVLDEQEESLTISQNLLNAYFLPDKTYKRENAWSDAVNNPEREKDIRTKAVMQLLMKLEGKELYTKDKFSTGLAALCHIAWEINHLPLLGILLNSLKDSIHHLDRRKDILSFYDNAINLFEILEHYGSFWSNILNELLVDWLEFKRGERMPQINVSGAGVDQDQQFLEAAKAIMNMQLAQEAKALRAKEGATGKRFEIGTDDILRNIVIASRDYQLEGMPEIMDYARLSVSKLTSSGSIPIESQNEAVYALAGLSYWLWGSQNTMHLDNEFIQGQIGVLNELLNCLKDPWQDKEWFIYLKDYETRCRQYLQSLKHLPYDEKLYNAIDDVLDKIHKEAEDSISKVLYTWPDAICETAVWISGCLIAVNTYSYIDGSVPETIGEKLTSIQHKIDGKTEELIYPWLDRGFKSIREKQYDELERWKYKLGNNLK